MAKTEGFVNTPHLTGQRCDFCGRNFGHDKYMLDMHTMQHHAPDMQTQYAQAWYTALQITPGIFPMAADETLKWVPAPVPQAVAPGQPLPSTFWPQPDSWGVYASPPQWGVPNYAPVPTTQWGQLMPGSGYVPTPEPEPVKPKPKKKEHPKPTVKRRLIDLDL